MLAAVLKWVMAFGLAALAACPLPAQAIDATLDIAVTAAIASGQGDAAIADLETALAAETDRQAIESLLRRLAELQAAAGKSLDAAETYTRLAALIGDRLGGTAPELATLHQAAGDLFAAAGETEKALAAYLDAMRIDALNGIAIDSNPLDAVTDTLIADVTSPRTRSRLEADKNQLRDLNASVNLPPTDAAPAGDEGFLLVKIYYATNRARTDSLRPNEVYGGSRGTLDYGSATVSIPKIHRPGALEAPSIFSFDVDADPERHLILRSVDPTDRTTVFADMRADLQARRSNEAFVFVHGFNVTFSDAARRTAQMAYDMNFDGLPILFSWPSAGNMMGYLADGAVVQLSGRLLTRFLEDVVRDTGATRIHLIAHSMGNRALTEALELFALRHKDEPPAFDQVLFTAPDLDAGLFALMVETIRPVADRMTLYTSKNDWALRVANQLNGGSPRAGEGAPGIILPAVIDSIDMSVLGEDMFAHSYFADEASALTDILSLFWRDAPPARRCGLTRSPSPSDITSAEWSLEPDLCDGNAMLEALRLLRGEHIGNLTEALAVIESRFPDADASRLAALETALRRLFQP